MTAFTSAALAVLVLLPQRARRRGDTRHARLVSRIDSLLPQTQCRECGYAGCRPYAEAIARGEAGLDRCPPGGPGTVLRLQRLLGRELAAAIDAGTTPATPVARIDEALCIGCVKCVRACPVDAIVGAAGRMHGVLAHACTGCGLCIPPCPVDCITLVPRTEPVRWQWPPPCATAAP